MSGFGLTFSGPPIWRGNLLPAFVGLRSYISVSSLFGGKFTPIVCQSSVLHFGTSKKRGKFTPSVCRSSVLHFGTSEKRGKFTPSVCRSSALHFWNPNLEGKNAPIVCRSSVLHFKNPVQEGNLLPEFVSLRSYILLCRFFEGKFTPSVCRSSVLHSMRVQKMVKKPDFFTVRYKEVSEKIPIL